MDKKKYIPVAFLMIISCSIVAQHCNININKPATATATWMPNVASNANDGTFAFGWAAPAFAPQNIFFDLQDTITLHTMHLKVSQSPAGITNHDIYVSLDMTTWTLVGSINQFTTSGDLLIKNFIPSIPNVRGIKVETTVSPSWISWHEIEVNPLYNASIDTIISPSCGLLGQIAVVDSGGTGSLQYSIDGGNTFQSSNIFSNIAGGNYTVIVQDSIGCRDTASFNFNVAIPTANISTTDSLLCVNDTTILQGNTSNNYQWSTGDTTQSIVVSPTSSQYYYLSTTDSGGCIVTDSIFITVNSLPNIIINGNDSVCQNNSTTLTATGGISYLWSNGLNTNTITYLPNSSAYINVIGTDTNGCINTDSLFINVIIPSNLFITGDTSICEGDIASLSVNNGTSFLWSSGETSQNINVSPTTTTTYTVNVVDGVCLDTLTHTISITNLPALTVPNDTTIINGETVFLSTNIQNNILWSPNNTIVCDTCYTTTASPTSSTTFCVAYDTNGCSTSNCFTVNVDTKCDDFFIPNIFSPNNDGNNDVLFVKGNCISNINLIIYNRWGGKVFETSDTINGWDGKNNGVNVGNGVYYYTIAYTDNNNALQTKKGNITLIR